MPIVDVIIPVYRPKADFKNILNRLLGQTSAPNHIFLLQTIEDDSELMAEFESDKISVHPIMKNEYDHGGTRRFGMTLSNAEFVLLMTQDAMPMNAKLIEKLLEPMADKKTAISYGRQVAAADADVIEKLTRKYNYPMESSVKTKKDVERLGIKAYFCSDVCALYRKSAYDRLGGFVKRALFNEDMIIACRAMNAGYGVAYCADAKVLHSHSYTCAQQFKRNFDVGASQKQHGEVFEKISSEKEGSGYAKKIIDELLRRRMPFKAFYFAVQCAFKLAGFELGKNYDRLPESLIMKCTMNRQFWLNQSEGR